MNSLRVGILLVVLGAALFDPSVQAGELRQVIGNGGLTIGFDAAGRICSIQWPSPGYYSQLSGKDGRASEDPTGIQWGLDIDGKILWVGGSGWGVTRFQGVARGKGVELSYRHEELGFDVEQAFRVDDEEDLLYASILVRGVEKARLVWYSDFAPMTQLTRLRKGVAGADAGSWDFAAVVNGKAKQIVHFRVRNAGSNVLELAREWIEEDRDYASWAGLGEGTWIAYTSEQHLVQLSTGVVGEGLKVLIGGGFGASLGDTHSLMVIEPEPRDGSVYGEIRVGFGVSGVAAESLLSVRRGSTDFFAEIEGVSGETLRFRTFRGNRTDLEDAADGLLSKLEVLTDRRSGSVVTNLDDDGYPYLVSTVEASYCIYALGLAGSASRAEGLLEFLLGRIYGSPDGSVPLGSVPDLLFADGEVASAHYEVDLLSAASLIWGVEAYGRTKARQEQRDFYRKHWDSVEIMADFLDQWAEPLLRYRARDFPEGSADLEVLTRDIASAYLGLEHAVRVALSADYPVPETWNRTRQRCYFFIRSRGLYAFAPWDIEYGFPQGNVVSTGELGNRGALKEMIAGLEPFEMVYLFASLGYQHRSAEQLPFALLTVIDGELEELLTSDMIGYSGGRIAIMLSMLFQSYH